MEKRNLPRAGMLGGEARGRSLQDLAHCVELNDLLMAELSDDEPSRGTETQKPALLQPLQRLSDGRSADTQVARNLLLAHPLPRSNATVRNGVPKVFINELRARSRAHHCRLAIIRNLSPECFSHGSTWIQVRTFRSDSITCKERRVPRSHL